MTDTSQKPGSDNVFTRIVTSIVIYKNFRFVWTGSWTEHLGEWVEITALLWLINQMTDSPLMGTLMVTLRYLPMVIFAFIGGIAADRMNRRNLLIYALAAAMLFALILALIIHTNIVQPWHLLLYSVIVGIITSFNHPARNTLVANLVDKHHYLNAITLDNASVMTSRILGAPLGGLIVGLAGTAPAILFRALGLLIAMVLMKQVQAPVMRLNANKETPLNNLFQGIRYIGENRPVLIQVLLYLLPFFITNSYTGLLPYFATNVLNIGPDLYGVLNAAPGIGSLIATLVLAAFVNFRGKGLVLLLAGIVQGLGMVFFAFAPLYAMSLLLLVVVGGANAAFMSLNNTMIQEMVTDEVRGRVMALREVAFGLGPAGSLITGFIASALTVTSALGIAGGISLVILGTIITIIPRGRNKT